MSERFILPQKRPRTLRGVNLRVSYRMRKHLHNHNERDGKPFEVFARLGKAGGCASAQTEAIGRLASLCLGSGIDPREVIKHLKGIQCDRKRLFEGETICSCADAVGKALEEFVKEEVK